MKIICITVLLLCTMVYAGNSKRLYDLCCKDNLFLFDNQLYQKVDGAPIGGCVSPSLAEIFKKHEILWLDNRPLRFRPVLYKRYVARHVPIFPIKRPHSSVP